MRDDQELRRSELGPLRSSNIKRAFGFVGGNSCNTSLLKGNTKLGRRRHDTLELADDLTTSNAAQSIHDTVVDVFTEEVDATIHQ